ncbi:uncharacterized protein LOC143842079 [Paroedura picta]|uniref:uncharacterized protein LOC143842079 n=1 Tax=Paroedura picta TaxID=143630 RepID=UPI0040569FDE
MRILNDYARVKIFPDSAREKPTQTYFTASSGSMPTPGKDASHETFPPKNSGPSSQTYEIIMLSLCGGIFVFAVAAIVMKTVRKRVVQLQSLDLPCSFAKDCDTAETGVAYITAEHKDGDQILTAQVSGPAFIRYIPEKETPSAESLTLEAKPDSDAMAAFSFTSSIMSLDVSPEK